MSAFILSDNQQEAFQFIVSNLSGQQPVLLEGSAGTGKTTLTKYICDHYNKEKNTMVCAIAPTHKSKKVIRNILNHKTLIPVSALTVASALGKIKEHSYVGTKQYSFGNSKKLSSYGLFIVDEVSMIYDDDLRIIIDYAKRMNKKLLIIGDSNQIPCPNAKYVVTNVVQKSDSFVFSDPSILKIRLSEIVRQAEGSPIIQLACFVRDHLLEDFQFHHIAKMTEFDGIIPYGMAYHTFTEHYRPEETTSCRIIAYTNSSVKTHNQEIRNCLGYEDEFVVGDLLTGYSNIGWPELLIENGEDYYVKSIHLTGTHRIGEFKNLNGKLINLTIADTKQMVNRLFFIHINHPDNHEFMHRLINLAEKLNMRGSTKMDYQRYVELKECVIFTEDIYKFDNTIYTEYTFKETHPLLFVHLSELVCDFKPIDSILAKKINTTYKDIISERLADKMKPVGDSEILADRFKMIEKDMYYGYAITAHKSQGSTYQTAIVDEADFQKITNKWNYRYDKLETRIKEKNQLRYVSYTRSKDNLFILYDTPTSERNHMEINGVEGEERDYMNIDIA